MLFFPKLIYNFFHFVFVDFVSIISNNFYFIILVLNFLIANCSRDFGNRNNISQTYLYITSFLLRIVNGLSRFIWGIFIDKFGFKKLMLIITIMEILVGSSIYFIFDFGILFIFELILVSLYIGVTFTILTPIFIQIFGLYVGPELYGLTGISIGISTIKSRIDQYLIVASKF